MAQSEGSTVDCDHRIRLTLTVIRLTLTWLGQESTLTPDKKIRPPLLPGLEPETF